MRRVRKTFGRVLGTTILVLSPQSLDRLYDALFPAHAWLHLYHSEFALDEELGEGRVAVT